MPAWAAGAAEVEEQKRAAARQLGYLHFCDLTDDAEEDPPTSNRAPAAPRAAGVSRFKGVSWDTLNSKWAAKCKGTYLGLHTMEIDAARACVKYVKDGINPIEAAAAAAAAAGDVKAEQSHDDDDEDDESEHDIAAEESARVVMTPKPKYAGANLPGIVTAHLRCRICSGVRASKLGVSIRKYVKSGRLEYKSKLKCGSDLKPPDGSIQGKCGTAHHSWAGAYTRPHYSTIWAVADTKDT